MARDKAKPCELDQEKYNADDNVKIICLGDSAVGKSKYVGGLGEQSQAQNRSGFLEAEPVPLFLQGHRGAWFLWVW